MAAANKWWPEVGTADCPQPWSSPLAGTALAEKRDVYVNRITRYYGLLMVKIQVDGYEWLDNPNHPFFWRRMILTHAHISETCKTTEWDNSRKERSGRWFMQGNAWFPRKIPSNRKTESQTIIYFKGKAKTRRWVNLPRTKGMQGFTCHITATFDVLHVRMSKSQAHWNSSSRPK